MRERLIELLKTPNKAAVVRKINPHFVKEDTDKDSIVADYLLANGVIVPPCKVGDTVYIGVFMKRGEFSHFYKAKVVGFHIGEFPADHKHDRKQYIIAHHENTNSISHIPLERLGKKAFIANSSEEAEQALKERDSQ